MDSSKKLGSSYVPIFLLPTLENVDARMAVPPGDQKDTKHQFSGIAAHDREGTRVQIFSGTALRNNAHQEGRTVSKVVSHQ